MSIDATQDFIDEVKGCIRENTIVSGDGTINLSPIYDEIDTVKESLNTHTSDDDVHTTIPEAAAIFSNPNLLDNPDFSINQRGKTEYVGSGYMADRWISTNSNPVITICDTEEDGHYINITVSEDASASTGHGYYRQYFDTPFEGVYTMSADIRGNGTFFMALSGLEKVVPGANTPATNEWVRHSVTLDTSKSGGDEAMNTAYFRIMKGSSIDIRNVKLEPGSVATPFVPPNPAVELAKCQRYLVPPPFVSAGGYAANANVFYFLVNLPSAMRTSPSLMEDSVIQMRKISDNSIFVDNLMVSTEYTPYIAAVDTKFQVVIGVNKPSHGLNPQDYYLSFVGNSGGFSAEI